jgi:hypothetical protein
MSFIEAYSIEPDLYEDFNIDKSKYEIVVEPKEKIERFSTIQNHNEHNEYRMNIDNMIRTIDDLKSRGATHIVIKENHYDFQEFVIFAYKLELKN